MLEGNFQFLLPTILSASCVGAAALPVLLARRFARYVKAYELSRKPKPRVLVSLILPCKGIDPGFEENIATIFEQDLPDKELMFATATDDDPACAVIRAAMSRYPDVKAKLIHAGLPDSCSQQNNNQLAAVAASRPESEIFVVLDSDIHLRPDYLTRLVEPLSDPAVSAATGYRWYSPVKGGAGSWLRSVWNGGALFFMPDTARNFAWGGSMAFRRRDFSLDTLRHLWGSTLSDDHTLSRHIREKNGKIVFVPKCMAVSYEDSTLASTIEWTTRQTMITRVYNPPFWISVLVVHGLQNIATAAGLALTIAWAFGGVSLTWGLTGLFLLVPAIGMCLAAQVALPELTSILPDIPAQQLRQQRWRYVLMAPAASLLCLWNSFASLLTSDVTWRGVTYRMVSPYRTIIVKGNS